MVNLSRTPANSGYPRVVASAQNVYVVWEDRRLGSDLEILFSASHDGGASFESRLDVSNSSGLDDTYPVMVVVNDIIYVAWMEAMPPYGCPDVMLAISRDGGRSFGGPVNVSHTWGDSLDLHLAVYDRYVYLSWVDIIGEQQGLNLARSADGGTTFDVSHISDHAYIYATDLAAIGNHVYVTWNGGHAIYLYAGLYSPGSPYTSHILTVASDVTDRARPKVAAAGADIGIIWRSMPADHSQGEVVYWSSSADSGTTVSQPAPLSGLSTGPRSDSATEAIFAGGSNLYMAWEEINEPAGGDRTADLDLITYRPGTGLGELNTLDNPEQATGGIRLAADGNHVYAAWVAGGDLRVATSMDGGSSFTTFTAYSAPNIHFGAADVAANGPNSYLAWMDATPGNFDVFFRATSHEAADIAVRELALVQAPAYPDRLAAGKATKLRAVIDNFYAEPRAVGATIAFEDAGGEGELAEDLILQPGSNELYLPAQPNGAFGGAFLRPSTGSGSTGAFTATLKLAQQLGDPPDNNAMTVTLPVSATRPLRVLFRPMGAVTETVPTCAEVAQLANGTMDFLKGIYPLDDRTVSAQIECLPALFGADDLMESQVSDGKKEVTVQSKVFNRLAQDRWGAGADEVVGVVRPNWFDDHGMPNVLGLAPWPGQSAIIDASTTLGVTGAHEMGHNFGLVPNDLAGSDGGGHFTPYDLFPSYWVARDQVRKGDQDFMVPAFNDGGGVPGGKHWISSVAFDYLLRKLAAGAPAGTARTAEGGQADAAPMIEVQGVITRTGGASLGPWYRQTGAVDLPLGHPGAYRLEYRDEGGGLLGQAGFDLSFAAPPDAPAAGDMDAAAFAFRVPDLPAAQRIALVQGSTTLAERIISSHAPTVTVTYPNGGEVLLTGQTVTATWTAADADGAPLSYRVSLSQDGGATWLPAAADLTSTQYAFSVPENILSEQILLKVTASDGINTANDTSDAVFSMRRNLDVAGCFAPAVNVTQVSQDNPLSLLDWKMAASGSHVYLDYSLWYFTEISSTLKLYVAASQDGGQTWGSPVTYCTPGQEPCPSSDRQIAAAGSNVYLVGEGGSGSSPALILSASHDYGLTFGAAVTVTRSLSYIEMLGIDSIHASGDDLYILWTTGHYPSYVPYLSVSHDAGATFLNPVRIASGSTGYNLDLVTSGSNVYVLYWGDPAGVYYRRSTDGGATFSDPLQMDLRHIRVYYAKLAVAGNNIYLAVAGEATGGVHYVYTRASTDGGATFGPEVDVEQSSRAAVVDFSMTGQNLYLLLGKPENNSEALWFAVSHDAGSTWSAPTRVSASGSFARGRLLAMGNQVWLGSGFSSSPSSGCAILARASTDSGDSFGPAHQLTPNGWNIACGNFRLAQADANVLLAWSGGLLWPMDSKANVMVSRSAACTPDATLVNPAPVPPVLGSLDVPATLPEGSSTVIAVTATDSNYDALHFSGRNLPSFANLEDRGGGTAQLTLAPWFGQAGAYSGLTVIASDGVFTDSRTFNLTITPSNHPPIARAGGPYLLPEGGTLHLDSAGSQDPDGDTLNFRWDFAGKTYDEATAAVPQPDNYVGPAALTVQDAEGVEATDTTLVQVYNVPPTVTVAHQGSQLVASFTDPGVRDTHIASVNWGDGAPPTACWVYERNGNGYCRSFHTYGQSGTYTVTVTVTDKDGGSGSASFAITVKALYLPMIHKT